jgi:hypothetical protein
MLYHSNFYGKGLSGSPATEKLKCDECLSWFCAKDVDFRPCTSAAGVRALGGVRQMVGPEGFEPPTKGL